MRLLDFRLLESENSGGGADRQVLLVICLVECVWGLELTKHAMLLNEREAAYVVLLAARRRDEASWAVCMRSGGCLATSLLTYESATSQTALVCLQKAHYISMYTCMNCGPHRHTCKCKRMYSNFVGSPLS